MSAADVSISIMIHLIGTLEKNLSKFYEADEHIGNTITDTIAFSETLWFREGALVHHATFIDPRYKNTLFGNKSLKRVSLNTFCICLQTTSINLWIEWSNPKHVRLNGTNEIQANQRVSLKESIQKRIYRLMLFKNTFIFESIKLPPNTQWKSGK